MRRYSKRKQVSGPLYDLTDIQRWVAAGKFHPYRGSALAAVVEVYGGTYRQAKRTIQQIIAALVPGNYSASVEMDNGAKADEYGLIFDEQGWYVKFFFHVADNEVDVCSCHLTRFPMQTQTERIDAYDPYDPE